MKTLDYEYFYRAKHNPALSKWLESIAPVVESQSSPSRHGHFPGWLEALHSLPPCTSATTCLDADVVSAKSNTLSEHKQQIKTALLQLSPWRKGPFQVEDIFVDTEWQSFLKWNRIAKQISPLKGRTILDVGCGNGYYAYRMLGAGAKTVVGVDPGELFCTQFAAINHFVKTDTAAVLPLTGEMVFEQPYLFDTVFSLGVLSHRRNPDEHLNGLLMCLKPGGELVLETLVIDSKDIEQLIPEDRYANMRNVWKLPNVAHLIKQLELAGFQSVRCVDVTRTTTKEQRPTEWMPSYSLENALNPADQSLTVEGYPAPTRAVIIAIKP